MGQPPGATSSMAQHSRAAADEDEWEEVINKMIERGATGSEDDKREARPVDWGQTMV